MNQPGDSQHRVNALKSREVPTATEGKEFAYDEDEPLDLIRNRPKE